MNSVSYAVAAGATTATIAPSRAVATVKLFRAGAYNQGDLFRSSNGFHYIVLVTGTYATEPTHRSGAVGNLLATAHKTRKALVLQNEGAADVYITYTAPATVETGMRLKAGANISLAWIQSGVYAITEGAASELRVAEIFE